MKLWIDADACPGVIRDIVLKAVLKRGVETVFVANSGLYLPDVPTVSLVKVAKGADVADQYIADNVELGDLVITQDIPLAAILVDKGITAISPHGTVFTNSNIGERLSVRNFLTELRDTGVQTGGPWPFGDKDKQQFANAFDQHLTRLLRA